MAECTKANGNCTEPSDDGPPAQCVGHWVREKHDYLSRYIEASRGARAGYLTPKGQRPAGGAAYIELFAGPGRARIRKTGVCVDGSPMIALRHGEAPFTRVILCEMDQENIDALKARTKGESARTSIIPGDCNANIDRVIAQVPPYGLNLALVDPYGLRALSFETLGKLAGVKRMDIILHFPVGDMKRNFDRAGAFYDRFFGSEKWRERVKDMSDVSRLIDFLKEQLEAFGYAKADLPSPAIKNSTGVTLYHLVFISKDKLGNKLWKSITQTNPHGQRSFNFKP